MGKKNIARRGIDNLVYMLKGEEEHPFSAISKSAKRQIFAHDRYIHLQTEYAIDVEKVSFFESIPGEYDMSVTIDGIRLPRFPRNPSASLLVNDVFQKMMLDYGDRTLFPWGKDITFEKRGKVQHPCYSAEEREEGHQKAKNTIEVYQAHREQLERVLAIIDDEYPTTSEEKKALVRRLQLPIWEAHVNENCSPIVVHPYAGIIRSERSKIFDAEPMKWFVDEAYELLEGGDKALEAFVAKYKKWNYNPTVAEIRRDLLQNLRYIAQIGLASVNWKRVDAVVPKVGDIKVDISVPAQQVKEMRWVLPFL